MDQNNYRAVINVSGARSPNSQNIHEHLVADYVNYSPYYATLKTKGGQGSFVVLGTVFKMLPDLNDHQPV